MEKENLHVLTEHGAATKLRLDINQGIASLYNHTETMIRPHVCLNGEKGEPILRKIADNPEAANSAIWLWAHPIIACDDVWLNVLFRVFLDTLSSDSHVCLSPQQTGYIVKNLPGDSRTAVVAQAKTWYLESFLVDLKNGLDCITKQFETGDPMLESDHHNRIFDIHGGCRMKDIPYCETDIVGEQLYWAIIHGGTLFEHGSDGYARADELILQRRARQKAAVDGFLGLTRELGIR